MNSVVAEDALREVYLLPFEIAVEESEPWSIMAAYNDVNGVAATEQGHVNNEVVKGEWGWDGLLMSDWFATKTSAPAALGGLDLVMPGPDGPWGEALVADVASGAVDESVIDEHLTPAAAARAAGGCPRRPGRAPHLAERLARGGRPRAPCPAAPAGHRRHGRAAQRGRGPAPGRHRHRRPRGSARSRDGLHGRRLGPGQPAAPDLDRAGAARRARRPAERRRRRRGPRAPAARRRLAPSATRTPESPVCTWSTSTPRAS